MTRPCARSSTSTIRGSSRKLVKDALQTFYSMRDLPGLKKKPSTSELLDWLKLLMNEDVDLETSAGAGVPANSPHLCMEPF